MMTIHAELEALLRIPFRRGGRDRDGADCLGLSLLVLAIAGVPEHLRPDPWEEVARIWREDPGRIDHASMFPAGWRRVSTTCVPPTGAALALMPRQDCASALAHIGAVACGRLWSTSPDSGPYAIPWARAYRDVLELWLAPPSSQEAR